MMTDTHVIRVFYSIRPEGFEEDVYHFGPLITETDSIIAIKLFKKQVRELMQNYIGDVKGSLDDLAKVLPDSRLDPE